MKYIEDWLLFDFDEVESTNDEISKLSQSNPFQKILAITKRQTKGRGRRGRSWVGLEGNLFASFGVAIKPRYIGELSFIVSLSILETIKFFDSNSNVKLKWPNDVLLNDKKVSGILIERGNNDFFIVGVGVNIVDYPQNIELLYKATSLKNEEIQTDRMTFVTQMMKSFNDLFTQWEEKGFNSIKDRWLENSKNLGKEIIVRFENEEKRGIFYGVDNNAYLLLEIDGNIEKIYAGDVFYI